MSTQKSAPDTNQMASVPNFADLKISGKSPQPVRNISQYPPANVFSPYPAPGFIAPTTHPAATMNSYPPVPTATPYPPTCPVRPNVTPYPIPPFPVPSANPGVFTSPINQQIPHTAPYPNAQPLISNTPCYANNIQPATSFNPIQAQPVPGNPMQTPCPAVVQGGIPQPMQPANAYNNSAGPNMTQGVRTREYGNPTVKPVENFNPAKDAILISRVLSAEDPNKEILINILCQRSLQQRLLIAQEYRKTNGANLINAFQIKLYGSFLDLILSLMTPLDDLDVQDLHKALDRYDFDVVSDILCTKSNAEIKLLKSMYESSHGKSLESFISDQSSASCKKLLLKICTCMRDESGIVNIAQAEMDAKNLNISTDDDTYFIDIFTTRSFPQIKLICEEYEKLFKKSIEKKIKSQFVLTDKQGFLVIARFACHKTEFYAKRLHKSMEGLGTNDYQLIRIIVTRSEIDLKDIKDHYDKIIKKGLKKWIEGDTSGHYKLGLLTLIEN